MNEATKTGDGAKDAEVKKFTNVKDLMESMEKDDSISEEYRNFEKDGNVQGFYDKYLEPEKTEKETEPEPKKELEGDPKPEPVKEEKTERQEPVSLTIDPSIFGDYGKDRTPEEALAEIVKGKNSANKQIKYLTKQLVPDLEEKSKKLEAVNQKLELKVKELEESVKKKVEDKPESKIDIEDDFSDVDFYTDEGIEKAKTLFKKQATAIKALLDEKADLKSEVSGLKKEVSSVVKTVQEGKASEGFQSEIQMLDSFAEQNKQEFPSLKRSILTIQKEFESFSSALARAAGIDSVKDASGKWTKDIVVAFEEYDDPDSQKGQKYREQLELEGVLLPEDYDDYAKMMGVRKIFREAEGKLTMADSLAVFNTRHGGGAVSNPKTEEEARRTTKRAAAEKKRDNVPAETPAASVGDKADLSLISQDDFQRIADKYYEDRTEEENNILLQVYMKQLPRSEAEQLVKLNKKPR